MPWLLGSGLHGELTPKGVMRAVPWVTVRECWKDLGFRCGCGGNPRVEPQIAPSVNGPAPAPEAWLQWLPAPPGTGIHPFRVPLLVLLLLDREVVVKFIIGRGMWYPLRVGNGPSRASMGRAALELMPSGGGVGLRECASVSSLSYVTPSRGLFLPCASQIVIKLQDNY